MSREKAIVIAIFCAVIGFGSGAATVLWQQDDGSVIHDKFSQAIASLEEGDSLELTIQEGATGSYMTSDGEIVEIKTPSRDYFRGMSWYGLGAIEGAVKDQGMQDLKIGTSNIGQIGGQYGYGVFESWWSWIKSLFWSIFWFILIVSIVLVNMSFIPATAPIAHGILRAIAGIFPVLGSVVENVVGRGKEAQKTESLKKVVKGGDRFMNIELPGALNTISDVTAGLREQILDAVKKAFITAQRSEQDEKSKIDVKAVR